MDLKELEMRIDKIRHESEDQDVLEKLHRLKEDIEKEKSELGGGKFSALNEHGGIIRRKVWALKIQPSKDKIEVHTADRDEPEEWELENFLEAHDQKIELINHDYLDKIVEEEKDEEESDG